MKRFSYLFATVMISALLAALPVESSASASLKADEVIRKWRTAVHAPVWVPSLEMVAVTNSTEEGIPAEVREWVTAGGDYKSIDNRPYDTTAYLLAGGVGSQRDWNGYVRPVEGSFLKRLKTAAYEESCILFGPSPSMAASVIDSGGATSLMLYAAAPSGDTIVWYLDRTSWRPIKSVVSGEDSKITTTYDDWREVSDILTPYQGQVEETDKPAYTWKRTTLAVVHDSGGRDFDPLVPGPSDAYFTGPTEPIPFTFENEHVIFKIAVNKHEPMWWLLDTGADRNYVNQSHLSELGLEPYGKSETTGGGGSTEYSFARGATFVLPGVELRNQHVAVLDQSGIERAYGMVMGGILGYDFISRFVVEIDYEKHLLMLHDAKTWQYQGNGLIVPITMVDGIPYADATISVSTKDAIPANVIIDFGAAETMTLTAPFVRANDLLRLAGTDTTVNKMAGLENQWFAQSNVRGRIDKLSMGNLRVDSFPVNLSVNAKGAYASSEFSGTVGEGIFRRYHSYLDYMRGRLIFEPTAETAKPYAERKTYGITLLASGDDLHLYTVVGVRAGSPAEKDGFKKGDIIAGLDGKPSSQFTLGELRIQLAKDGEHHDIRVVRGDSTLTFGVEIRRVSLGEK